MSHPLRNPHNTSLVPHSVVSDSPRQLITQHLARFEESVMRKVLYENAARVYKVDVPAAWAPAVV